MPEQRTPANLLDGQIWAGWGPQVERTEATTEAVVELLVEQTGRPRDFVESTVQHSQDLRRYLLTRLLSSTKHAAVYRGVDRKLERGVALKIHRDRQRHDAEHEIHQSQSAPPRSSAPSPRAGLVESRTMSRLAHPNIVQIHEMGEHDMGEQGAWLYSVMELCDETLNEYCRRHEWPQIIDRFIETIHGLIWLHECGYAHGDIKGNNILIKSGTAKLSDFGFARRPQYDDPDDAELERLFRKYVCGTPGFIAPEVAIRGPEFPGDVFALAVTMWIAVHREPPYPVPVGEDLDQELVTRALVQMAQEGEIKPPDYIPIGLPADVPKVLKSALHPNPHRRPKLGRILKTLNAARAQHEKRIRRWRTVLVSAGEPWSRWASGSLSGPVTIEAPGKGRLSTLRSENSTR